MKFKLKQCRSLIFTKILLPLIFFTFYNAGFSCTVVIAWEGDKVLVGNNEDWYDMNAKYWYEPSDKNNKYGAIFFGFKKEGKYAQGGMNSEGLFFDGLYIEKIKLEKSTRLDKKAAPQHVFKKMLHNASTVEEALEYLEPYFIPFIKSVQIVIADKKGDYAVLNVNGITRRRLEKEKFVLISNFPAEEISPKSYSDPQFDKAQFELENSTSFTTDVIKNTLNICHQNGKVKSVYSNIFDLTDQRITNYYLYDFKQPYIIDVKNNINCEIDKEYLFAEIFPSKYEEVKSISNER